LKQHIVSSLFNYLNWVLNSNFQIGPWCTSIEITNFSPRI
jgi:hypothetical protein